MARITRIALDIALDASKSLKSASAIAWQYLKVEAVPPMTLGFFHGPGGKALENAVSNASDKFINSIENQIKEIEAEKIREIKRKEAAAQHELRLQQKVKAEAKRKAEEAEKLKAKAQKKAEAQKAQAKKEVPETKTGPVKSKPKKKTAKRKSKKT